MPPDIRHEGQENKAFFLTTGVTRPFIRGKTPIAVSCLILILNYYFLKNTDSYARKK